MNPKHKLPIDLEKFGFVVREKQNGKTVKNKCGRDFFYYALHYYFPKKFNPTICPPTKIDKKHIFGFPMPSWLVWTCLSFLKIPKLFDKNGLILEINSLPINSFFSFLWAMIFPKQLSFDETIRLVQKSIDTENVCGIDIALGLRGLSDHVIFVYGYDTENMYVFDTHAVEKLEYVKLTPEGDERFFMKLPYPIIKKHWSRFNRVWVVRKIP